MDPIEQYQSGFHRVQDYRQESGRRFTPLFLTVLTVCSMMYCIQNSFYPDMTYVPMVAAVLTVSLLLFLLSRNDRWLLTGLGVCVAAAFLVAAVGYQAWRAGGLDFLNRILLRYNYMTGLAYDYFDTSFYGSLQTGVILFFTYFCACITLYLGLMIQRQHPVLLLFCWLPVIGGSIFLQLSISGLVVASAVVSVVGTFAYSQMKLTDDRIYAWTVLGLGIILGVVAVLYFHNVTFRPNAAMTRWKEYVVEKSEQSRYGTADSPQGKVSGSMDHSEEVRLKVEMTEPMVLYLRGYTGSVWKNRRWIPLEGKSYSDKYEGMIRNYQSYRFHPLAQLSRYIQIADQISGAEVRDTRMSVTVRNVGAFRKYQYIPYGIDFEDLMRLGDSNQDVYLPGSYSTDAEENIYTAEVNALPQDAMLSYTKENWLNRGVDISQESGEYRIAEEDYREFVYSYYRQVPDQQKQDVLQQMDHRAQSDLFTMTVDIREKLITRGESQKEWNTTDYSSAAVLMYRSQGIPARYVEGYIANGENTAVSPDGRYHIDVLGKHAHAWVEIYKDGVGWLPVEVTPGYYSDLSGVQQETQQSASADSQQNQEDEEELEPDAPEALADRPVLPMVLQVLLMILAAVVFVCLLLVMVLCIRRQIILRARKQREENPDLWIRLEQSVEVLFIMYRYKRWKEQDMDQEMQRILAAYRYSGHPETLVSESDVQRVCQYMQETRQDLYQAAGRIEQLRMKYVEVIL